MNLRILGHSLEIIAAAFIFQKNSLYALASPPCQLTYHNGTVISGTVNLYHIYLGKFLSSTTKILETFANNLGQTAWMSVLPNSYYYMTKTGQKILAASGTKFAGSASYLTTASSLNLSNAVIQNYVNQFIGSGKTADPNGIYLVFFNGGFTAAGWNTGPAGWCGYHIPNSHIAVIGNPASFGMSNTSSNCIPTLFKNGESPNGDIGADSMLSTYAHETADLITNVDGNGWNCNAAGSLQEVADFCNRNFIHVIGNYNINVKGAKYLIQAIYQLNYGCVLAPQQPSATATTASEL